MKTERSTNPFISIIITNRNARKWLNKCLTSLNQQTMRNFEVIFVDNNSSDRSTEFVSQKFPWVHVIKSNRDLGYAGANNLGARRARGKYLFLMNTDAYLAKDTIQKLTTTLKKYPQYHLMQLDEKKYDKSDLPDRYLIFSMDVLGYPIGTNGKGPLFYADGAALVITKKLFTKLRGYDTEYYMYLEDMDLNWRARLLGENVYFLKDIYVYHYAGGTSISTHAVNRTYTTTPMRRYHAQKNNLRGILKNYSIKNVLWSFPISVLLASMEGFLYLVKGNVDGFIALHKSIGWNILHIYDTLRERTEVQKLRTVDDFEVMRYMIKTVSKFQALKFHGIPKMKI